MGIPTLIKTQTASDSAYLDFIDGTSDVVLDSTYDEYMFVFTDIGPAADGVYFQFQVNATDDAGGSFDSSPITSTFFYSYHAEADSTGFNYHGSFDLANAASFQSMTVDAGNGSDESAAGMLHIFTPSSTTYVKHFHGRVINYLNDNRAWESHFGGYINDTTAIDEIRFKMSSDNFDGVIQLYGIA